MKVLIFLLITFSLSGCFSDKKPNFTKDKVLKMGRDVDPDLKVMVPSSIAEALVHCGDYTPRCRTGYRIIVKNIQMVALYYEDQDNAAKAARRIRGYVARNWVFDEVTGEPILERFVKDTYGAVKAEQLFEDKML